MEQMALLFTCSVLWAVFVDTLLRPCSPKLQVTYRGATLLFPKGASPLSPCSRCLPFQCSCQGAKKEDEFCWPLALQADGCEGSSSGPCAVSVAAAQDRNVYCLWDSHQPVLHTPLWKHLGAFFIFFLIAVWKNKCLAMVITSRWI